MIVSYLQVQNGTECFTSWCDGMGDFALDAICRTGMGILFFSFCGWAQKGRRTGMVLFVLKIAENRRKAQKDGEFL